MILSGGYIFWFAIEYRKQDPFSKSKGEYLVKELVYGNGGKEYIIEEYHGMFAWKRYDLGRLSSELTKSYNEKFQPYKKDITDSLFLVDTVVLMSDHRSASFNERKPYQLLNIDEAKFLVDGLVK